MNDPVTPLDCWDEVWIPGDALHITPVDDALEHELDPHCPCLPYCEPLDRGDLLIVHNAWDGRE